ncbi:hypothetical protein HK104_008392, partial [Borealophlyctis nickersoniae]
MRSAANPFNLPALADSHAKYRQSLKDIKYKQEHLAKLLKHQKSLQEKVEHASKREKAIADTLRVELAQLDLEVAAKTAELRSFKRSALREGVEEQFRGMLEFAGKAQLIGTYGMQLASQIPLMPDLKPGDPLPLYQNAL